MHIQSSTSYSSRPLTIFLLFLLVLGIVYSPVLYFDYLFHDDVYFWLKLKEFGFKHPLHDYTISMGRYAQAWLETFENIFVHKVSDLKFLRFLGIVVLSANAYLCLQQLRRLSWPDIQSFLVLASMFVLPGFADIVFYAVWSFLTLAILLAVWSFHKVQTSKAITSPIFILFVAITIYPPCAMFYWTMVGASILFTKDRFSSVFKKDILRTLAVGLSSLLAYAFLILMMKNFYGQKVTNTLYNPYEISQDVVGKLQWFFHEPLINALNLWSIFPKVSTAIAVFVFITLTALIIGLMRLKQAEVYKRREIVATYLWQLGLFVFVFFLTFLPNLAAHDNAAFYRCLIPLTSLVLFALIWALIQWVKIIASNQAMNRLMIIGLLSIAVVYGGIKTYQNVLCYRVLLSHVEWSAFRLMAENISLKKVDAIYMIRPNHIPPIERYDEFGVVSSHYQQDLYSLLLCAFREAGNQEQYPVPLIFISDPDDKKIFYYEEIYFKKLSNEKWVFRRITKADSFHEFEHSFLGETLDEGTFGLVDQSKDIHSQKSLYILDLRTLFSLENFV